MNEMLQGDMGGVFKFLNIYTVFSHKSIIAQIKKKSENQEKEKVFPSGLTPQLPLTINIKDYCFLFPIYLDSFLHI